MEPEVVPKKSRFKIEVLEERIAPAHVNLPAAPGDGSGPGAAPDRNPHFSGELKEMRFRKIIIMDI